MDDVTDRNLDFTMIVDFGGPGRWRPIYSIVTEPVEPPPPLTISELRRTIELIDGYPSRRWARELRHGAGIPEQLAVGLDLRPDDRRLPFSSVFGIRLVPDETLAPGEWRLLADDGTVLRRSPGAPRAMPSWPGEVAGDRIERIIIEQPPAGDLLARIDAAVAAWEHVDAAHWTPALLDDEEEQ